MFSADEVTLSYKNVCSDEVGSARCADRTSQRDVPTTEGEIRARYLVDASGRTSVLGRQFQIKKTYEHLQKLSIFAHYDGVWRPEGIDGTLKVLIRAVDRWFWLIPLTDERTSVGVVLDSETFRKSKLSAEIFWRKRWRNSQPLRNG